MRIPALHSIKLSLFILMMTAFLIHPSFLFSQGYIGSQSELSSTDAKENLTKALKSYKRRDFLRASLLLYDIIRDRQVATNPIEEQAEYVLGKTLYRLNLYQELFL